MCLLKLKEAEKGAEAGGRGPTSFIGWVLWNQLYPHCPPWVGEA